MHKFFPLVILIVSITGCQSLFFWPKEALVDSPQRFGFSREVIFLKNKQGIDLHGWYLSSRSEKNEHLGTLYILHGNAANLSYHIANFYWLIDYGWNIFILDYQGYGRSGGTPSFKGIIDDAEAGYQWLRNELGDNEDIIVLGQSLGGAAAIGLVSRTDNPPAGLIVDSGFSSHRQIFQDTLAKSWILWSLQWPLSLAINDNYAPIKLIGRNKKVPTLFVHSKGDTLISLEHANALFEKTAAPKMLWIDEESAHAQIWQSEEWKNRLVCQLREWPELHRQDDLCISSELADIHY